MVVLNVCCLQIYGFPVKIARLRIYIYIDTYYVCRVCDTRYIREIVRRKNAYGIFHVFGVLRCTLKDIADEATNRAHISIFINTVIVPNEFCPEHRRNDNIMINNTIDVTRRTNRL